MAARSFLPWRRRRALNEVILTAAIKAAQHPDSINHVPERDRPQVIAAAEALQKAAAPGLGGTFTNGRGRGPLGSVSTVSSKGPTPINVSEVALRASQALAPSASITPAEIEVALRRQGVDWVEPFAPGRPLVPYYGYDRRPRGLDYMPGRNITTDSRPDRLPFAVIKQVIEGYDIASICIRHTINDIRSMKLDFGPMEGYTGDVQKEILEAKRFLKKPDGVRRWPSWMAAWMMDVLRYDAGCMWKERNADGSVRALKLVQGSTVAPILDYYGDRPEPPAPAFQQFIQGLPWDWLSSDDVIYEPQWPVNEDPYGVAPIETCLLNANTDVRLQLFFLQFFTEGTVPEMLLEAPADMSDADGLRDIQELWDDWYQNNQKGRHGGRWIPHDSKPFPYKPQQFDPKLSEYVMRRTVAAFGMVPEDLGFTETVNRATADTQMDTQFRLTTLPNTEYYEAILDSILQDDLQLPVACHFDTGREKEDRLMEAQSHQIYVSIGAESPDEVRDRVLGLPVDNQNRVGRFFESTRLGPVPLAWIESVQGEIDPTTLSPRAGTVTPQPFVPIPEQGAVARAGANKPGDGVGDDIEAPKKSGTSPAAKPAATSTPSPKGEIPVGGLPKTADPSKPKTWVDSKPGQKPRARQKQKASTADPRGNTRESVTAGRSQAGYGSSGRARKSTAGITSATALAGVDAPVDDAEEIDGDEIRKELSRWRANSRSRFKIGRSPRRFESDILPSDLADRLWKSLEGADQIDIIEQAFLTAFAEIEACFPRSTKRSLNNDEMADRASDKVGGDFAKAKTPTCNGLVLRAADTGRVLMLQRALHPKDDDPAAGMWEFPGGRAEEGESPVEAAQREWEEEVGIHLPKKARKIGEWDALNGIYRGHIFEIPKEKKVELTGREEVKNPDGDIFEAVAWFDPNHLSNHPGLRPELKADIAQVQNAIQGGTR